MNIVKTEILKYFPNMILVRFVHPKYSKCGGEMKIISFIEQSSLIRRILKHLDLREDPRPPPEPLEIVCEPCADYIPWQDDVPEIEAG